ncbi:MAG: putative beta-lysine N-acetyltransferase [Bacteroidetes bacterium]|nr:putative beta-lysine N-acetyltransferase [Bacteroidota bacterium]
MIKETSTSTAWVRVSVDSYNKRLRVDDYSGSLNEVLFLITAQIEPWVEKLILKSRETDVNYFLDAGFRQEAVINGYFAGVNMAFLVRYLNYDRQVTALGESEEDILQKVHGLSFPAFHPDPKGIVEAVPEDAKRLAELYASVMKIYPTPIYDPDFVLQTIRDGTLYVYLEEDGKIVSAASAEPNMKWKNAELTDCATLPEAQGKGRMQQLLYFLEKKIKAQGFMCAYTIARAQSFGMNKVFHQLGYHYGGRMTNNCYIYSGLEDMNVWYKLITD